MIRDYPTFTVTRAVSRFGPITLLTLAAPEPKDFHATNAIQEDSVLVDHRTYKVKPGKLAHQIDLYAKHGFAAQVRHLGPPIAYLQTESGELNALVHLWAFEDAADRARKRAVMLTDPEWQNFLKLNGEAGYLVEQRNNLMVPTSFAPLKR